MTAPRAPLETAADDWGLNSGCSDESVEPYDDGAFVGTHVTYTGCGSGSAEYHLIAANPADQSFTAVVRIQIAGPQEADVVDGIIASFNRAGAGRSTTRRTSRGRTSRRSAGSTTS